MKLKFFRAGKHTASSGQSVEFSHSELAAIATNYSPSLRAAPLILGHDPLIEAAALGQVDTLTAYVRNALSELAFGMVKSVEVVNNNELVANIDPVSPRYLKMVREGELIGLSASFFEANALGNPTPGLRYLKHIAVLGKTPSALSDLLPLSQNFSQSNIDGIISINFSDMDVVELQKQNQALKLQLERGNRLSEIAATVGALTNLPISFNAAPTDNIEFAAGQPAIYQWLLGLENHQYRFAIDLIKHLGSVSSQQSTNFSLLNSEPISAIATPQSGGVNNSIYTGASLRAESQIEAFSRAHSVSFKEAAERLGYV
ncbi:hypothetical protein [Kamptonema sp. UHCC 0994]|uniref:hypothetical protein n=1 Tax=Kamptonema sp. UHCC 0994 TaxID=3031329 RepID=UPI0023B8CD48|nr:hypothetical protein [Kamptonema sp. UHCC 0994]MDF0553145.1 hypothetical protein [Kamptonema sp. UHCC 0994]